MCSIGGFLGPVAHFAGSVRGIVLGQLSSASKL